MQTCTSDNECSKQCGTGTGNSANLATGQVTEGPITDFILQGTYQRIEFKRYYYNTWTNSKPLGYGWTHNFNSNLVLDSNSIQLLKPTGENELFLKSGTNKYISGFGDASYIIKDQTDPDPLLSGATVMKWHLRDGTIFVYAHFSVTPEHTYRLRRVDYPSGQKIELTYDATYEYQVSRIYDPVSSRGADITYDGNHEITHIQIDTTNHVDYTIGATYSNLDSVDVTLNGSSSNYYSYYYDTGYTHSIIGVHDAAGNHIETIGYWGDGRAQYVKTAEHEYEIEYNDTTSVTQLTDLKTNATSNVSYDKLTSRLLNSDACIGSCSAADGGTYLYDGRNNKVISQNNDFITESFYDSDDNFKGKVYLSYLDRTTGGLTDDFTDPDVNALNWRLTPGSLGTWLMQSPHELKITPVAYKKIYFSSQDRISLKGNFTITLKYHIERQDYSSFDLVVANESVPDDTWVKLRAGTTINMNNDFIPYFNCWYSYLNETTGQKLGPPYGIGQYIRSGTWGDGDYEPLGELIISRDSNNHIQLSAKDGMEGSTINLWNSSSCSNCDFSDDMFIQFGSTEGYAAIDEIEVTGDEVENYEFEEIPDQAEEVYTYYGSSGNALAPGTLLEDREKSLKSGSNKITRIIYDYDSDYGDTGFNQSPTKYVHQIVKKGWIDTNLDGTLDANTTYYTCLEYSSTLEGKITKEHLPSPQNGCTAPYTEFQYYSTSDQAYGHYKKGDLYKKVEGSGALTTTYAAYDSFGNPTKVSDPNGVKTDYTYDNLGRVTLQVADSGGGNYTTTYTYKGDKIDTIENPTHATVKYLYGDTGQLLGMDRIPSPTSGATIERMKYQYAFLTNGNHSSSTETDYTTGSGNTVRKVYVENGTLIYSVDGFKRKYQKVIDGDSASGQSHITTLTIFNDDGNPLAKIVDPQGAQEQTYYYGYNSLGQLSSMTDPNGFLPSFTYQYDIHGNLVTTNGSFGAQYRYDDFGRLIENYNNTSGATLYKYDSRGNLIQKEDANNITVSYTYDALKRLEQIAYPNDSPITYTYDGTTITMPDTTTIKPPYTNAKGRLTGVSIASTGGVYPRYFTYEYDARGNVTKTIMGIKFDTIYMPYQTQYQYDADGGLSQITYPDNRVVAYAPQTGDPSHIGAITAVVNGSAADIATSITYFPFGDLKSLTYGNLLTLNIQLDKRYFPQQITAGSSGSILNLTYNNSSYMPDHHGNIKAIIDNNDSTRSQYFDYNQNDWLSGAEGKYGSYAWGYDSLGRGNREYEWLMSGDTDIQYYNDNSYDRLVMATVIFSGNWDSYDYFDYDNAGTLDGVTITSTQGGATVNFLNNDDNRLVQITSNGEYLGDYFYDHLGQRVLKNDTSTTTIFIYDILGNLIGEYNPDGTMIADYVYLGSHRLAKIQVSSGGEPGPGCQNMRESLPSKGELSQAMQNNWALMLVVPMLVCLGVKYRKRKFVVFGLAIIGAGTIILLMSEESKSQSPTEAVYYYHNDHLGTPLKMTDQYQAVKWDAIYKPFGEIYSTPVATIQNNFRFPGQYDDGTQLYYNANRYYIPALGRYNRVDPLEQLPNPRKAKGNPYIYVENNPEKFTDSFGLCISCDDCPSGRWSGGLGQIGGFFAIAGYETSSGWLDCWGNNKSVHIMVECLKGGVGLAGYFGVQGNLPITSSCCNKCDFSGTSWGSGFSPEGWLIIGGGFSSDVGKCISFGSSFGVGLGGYGSILHRCKTTILN